MQWCSLFRVPWVNKTKLFSVPHTGTGQAHPGHSKSRIILVPFEKKNQWGGMPNTICMPGVKIGTPATKHLERLFVEKVKSIFSDCFCNFEVFSPDRILCS